ncbi:MAG TPA: acyl-ACP--UDP-N-acetylglucosamine O-acyltransferase [Rhizomicrobium sp.]|jgi:UDP-N-acetylglucosamine acyltransferase
MKIHPTAIVEDGARLGADVEIGPYSLVGPHVVLGDGVKLHSHVVMKGRVELGARSIVHSHAVLGDEGQIRNHHDPNARLVIGTDTVIREAVTMHTGSKKGGGITTIGDRGYFMATSHIGHDCHVGNDVTFANGVQLGGHAEIGDGVIIGGTSAVAQFRRVGKYAFVGGVSGVARDVIPYGMGIDRGPALDGLNLIGFKRRNVPRETIHKIRAAYRTIFLSEGGSVYDRAAQVREEWPDIAEIQDIATFILHDRKLPIAIPQRRRAQATEE